MTCRICGRGNCTQSFHSIDEQVEFEKDSDKTEAWLIRELLERDTEITDLKEQCEDLEKQLEKANEEIELLKETYGTPVWSDDL